MLKVVPHNQYFYHIHSDDLNVHDRQPNLATHNLTLKTLTGA